ncbi:MAG: hypothetical protein QNJ55_08170 [Xenococcus sp. MO_188.B8]|nr:hypothetical protein [Xenococcus sp. MO_188.B8]
MKLRILAIKIPKVQIGFNPFPGIALVTNTVVCGLIFKMIRDLGSKWGYPRDQDAIAAVQAL